jgi:hypothetical protein
MNSFVQKSIKFYLRLIQSDVRIEPQMNTRTGTQKQRFSHLITPLFYELTQTMHNSMHSVPLTIDDLTYGLNFVNQ